MWKHRAERCESAPLCRREEQIQVTILWVCVCCQPGGWLQHVVAPTERQEVAAYSCLHCVAGYHSSSVPHHRRQDRHRSGALPIILRSDLRSFCSQTNAITFHCRLHWRKQRVNRDDQFLFSHCSHRKAACGIHTEEEPQLLTAGWLLFSSQLTWKLLIQKLWTNWEKNWLWSQKSAAWRFSIKVRHQISVITIHESSVGPSSVTWNTRESPHDSQH